MFISFFAKLILNVSDWQRFGLRGVSYLRFNDENVVAEICGILSVQYVSNLNVMNQTNGNLRV